MISDGYRARFNGVESLLGPGSLDKLKNSHVCVIGIGGVGSWVVESLARSGVGELSLVDLDEICVSNTNRQLHTTTQTIGMSKVEVMAKRCLDINPEIIVHRIEDFLTVSTKEFILAQNFDFVCDAIDGLSHKCEIISYCNQNNIPLLTFGGAGGKCDPSLIRYSDLNKSFNDKLLYRVRKKLRADYNFPRTKKTYGIHCVFSPEDVVQNECELEGSNASRKLDCSGSLGVTTFMTCSMAMLGSSVILKELCGKK